MSDADVDIDAFTSSHPLQHDDEEIDENPYGDRVMNNHESHPQSLLELNDDEHHIFAWRNITKKFINKQNPLVTSICRCFKDRNTIHEPEVDDSNSASSPDATTTVNTILNDVDGVVESGEFLAIMGLSGSGKTSLLQVLGGRSTGAALTAGGAGSSCSGWLSSSSTTISCSGELWFDQQQIRCGGRSSVSTSSVSMTGSPSTSGSRSAFEDVSDHKECEESKNEEDFHVGASATTSVKTASSIASKPSYASSLLLPFSWRCHIGFVSQEDYFNPHLTIREQLTYDARLRSRLQMENVEGVETMTEAQQINLMVETTISKLYLDRCADTMIAYISGGEKKRLSIGSELLSHPKVLILDEATSGLDSAAAESLIWILRQLCHGQDLITPLPSQSGSIDQQGASTIKRKNNKSMNSPGNHVNEEEFPDEEKSIGMETRKTRRVHWEKEWSDIEDYESNEDRDDDVVNIESDLSDGDDGFNEDEKQDLSQHGDTAQSTITSRKSGTAIILSIHQPSTRIFYSFDRVLFLSEGNIAYYDSPYNLERYLLSLGFRYYTPATPAFYASSAPDSKRRKKMKSNEKDTQSTCSYNPADFMLELLRSNYPFYHSSDAATEERKGMEESSSMPYFNGWYPRYILTYLYDPTPIRARINQCQSRLMEEESKKGVKANKRKRWSKRMNRQPTVAGSSLPPPVQLPLHKEISILISRTLLTTRRSTLITHSVHCLEVLVMSVLAGITWFRLIPTERRIFDLFGFLFFILSYWFFASLFDGLLEFIPERVLLYKERASGSYRLISYFIAKLVGDLPIRLTFTVLFTIVAYCLGVSVRLFAGKVEVYLLTLLQVIAVLLLTVFTAESLGEFIGSVTGYNIRTAVSLASVFGLAMLMFGGFYVKPSSLVSGLSWLKYLSLVKYSYDALGLIVIAGMKSVKQGIVCDAQGRLLTDCYYYYSYARSVDSSVMIAHMNIGELSILENVMVLLVAGLFLKLMTFGLLYFRP